jgi:tetratricopeptide (TPR) repeat protein
MALAAAIGLLPVAPVSAAAPDADFPATHDARVNVAQNTMQFRAAPSPNAWWASWPQLGRTDPTPLSLGFAIGVGVTIAVVDPAPPGSPGHVTGKIIRADRPSRIVLMQADDGSTVAAQIIKARVSAGLLKFRVATATPDIDWTALKPGVAIAFDCRERPDHTVDITNLNVTAAPTTVAITALVNAAGAGDLAKVKALLAAKPGQAEVDTAMIYAAQKGHLTALRALLAAKATVDTKLVGGATALMVASQNGHLDVVRELIAAGAAVNGAEDDGATALMFAAQRSHLDVAQALLAAKADVNAKRRDGATALMLASVVGDFKIAAALLGANADVNAKDVANRTALTNAASLGHVEVVRALLAARADANITTADGATALSLATKHGFTPIVQLLEAAPRVAAAPAAAQPTAQPTANDADAFFNRGAAYDGKEQYDRAIQEYDQAIRLKPNYTAALYNRGLDYANQGQFDRAIGDLDQAIRLNPNDADAFLSRGSAYDSKTQYTRAIQDYDQAIRLKPGYALAFYDRGFSYFNNRQYDRAVQDFDQAIRFNSNDADALFARARAKQAMGDRAGADADSAKARQLNPKLPPLEPVAAAAPEPARDAPAAQAPAAAKPPEAFSMFVPVTKPGQKEPSIARVTAGTLDSVADTTIKLKSDNGAVSVFSTDAQTVFCVHGVKAQSIKDLGALTGRAVSAYTEPAAKANDAGRTYAFRVEDGGPEMTINLGPKAADGTNGTLSFPEKPCQDAAPGGAGAKP